MPRDKDLKRLVRTRMTRTGESYTTARAHVTSRTPRRKTTDADPIAAAVEPAPGVADPPVSLTPPADAAAPDYATLAGMSDETIEARTGCDWNAWVYALDRRRAFEMSHREIADIVHAKYDVPGWWAQAVTVGYERIKGLREKGQRRGGGYEASRSRTFPVPVEALFDAWAQKRTRKRWLRDVDPSVRTATRPRSMRLGMEDGTVVALWFTAKGEEKSVVSVQHLKLPDRTAADRSKKAWGERLDALAEVLGRGRPRA